MEDFPNNNLEQMEQINPEAQSQSRGEMTMRVNGEVENAEHNEEYRAGESMDDKSKYLQTIRETREKYDKEFHKYDIEFGVLNDLSYEANHDPNLQSNPLAYSIIRKFLVQAMGKHVEDEKMMDDFVMQQGVNIITDEKLKEEWIEHVKKRKDAPYGLMIESLVVKGMEMIAEGRKFDEIKEIVFPPLDKPRFKMIAARMIAALSPKGEEFAKYAGIDDLPKEDSIGDYYKNVTTKEGWIRGPFNEVMKY